MHAYTHTALTATCFQSNTAWSSENNEHQKGKQKPQGVHMYTETRESKTCFCPKKAMRGGEKRESGQMLKVRELEKPKGRRRLKCKSAWSLWNDLRKMLLHGESVGQDRWAAVANTVSLSHTPKSQRNSATEIPYFKTNSKTHRLKKHSDQCWVSFNLFIQMCGSCLLTLQTSMIQLVCRHEGYVYF